MKSESLVIVDQQCHGEYVPGPCTHMHPMLQALHTGYAGVEIGFMLKEIHVPSKYFGANAAWLKLAAIAHNVLTALKRIALPAELLRARPKRLRFLIINTAGRLVQHARKMRLRLAALEERIALWKEALRLLPVAT